MTHRSGAGSRRLGNAFMSLLVIGILASAVYLGVDEARRQQLKPDGVEAPDFTLPRAVGGTLSLSQHRGKVVMLDFWATWCPPCVEEMPSLVRLAQQYESKGLVFVAANRDDPDEAASLVSEFARRRVPDLLPYVVFADDDVSDAYQVRALPTVYFVGRDGRVLDAHSGGVSEATLRRWVEAALEAP